ncbi:MAG: ABC transporter ATP-binding protein, partial [Rhizobiaceae bacterium]|nr:ABC transporter ATP-binding protein [Rhizobiaceae bacterium]
MTNSLDVRNLSHSFGGAKALDDVSLAIPGESFTVLLGPSGSGKTTLLSLLGGFLSVETGEVLIGGRDVANVPPARRPTATVFQDYALFPHMTIAGNVGFGLRMNGMRAGPRRERTQAMLDLVGLSAAGGRKPHELSGGQKQRVALARALAVEPSVLLLDEPLGALDLKLRRQMQEELIAIRKKIGATFVHVTHDQEEAMAIADTIVVMNRGRIEDMGPPQAIYLAPKTVFSATFMGQSNLLPGRIARRDGGRVLIETALGAI